MTLCARSERADIPISARLPLRRTSGPEQRRSEADGQESTHCGGSAGCRRTAGVDQSRPLGRPAGDPESSHSLTGAKGGSAPNVGCAMPIADGQIGRLLIRFQVTSAIIRLVSKVLDGIAKRIVQAATWVPSGSAGPRVPR